MVNLYPFLANVLIFYPLKTVQNQKFSVGHRGQKIGTLARNGLNVKSVKKHYLEEMI